jgi:hypothetical protein
MQHGIGPHIALHKQPATATESMIPALVLNFRQILGGARNLAAVAKFGHVTGAAVGACYAEGHEIFSR